MPAVIHASPPARRGRTLLAQREAADSSVDSRRASDYDAAVTPPLRACAMWLLLTTPACTIGLDWTYPATPGDGAPPVEDASLDDRADPMDATPMFEVGAVDTGILDTGPGSMMNCGEQGERCCAFGICGSGRVCVVAPGPMMSRVCERCGGDNERCCAFGLCGSGRFCTMRPGESSPLCRECGGSGEQCCFNRSCSGERCCDMRPGAPYPTCQ